MKCPKCQQEMEIKNKDISNNPENGKKYERVLYVCKIDDVWINTEIPITQEQNLA